MAHRFHVQQLVRMTHRSAGSVGTSVGGVWEIVRLLPEDQTGERSYRIRAQGAERAAREGELEAATAAR